MTTNTMTKIQREETITTIMIVVLVNEDRGISGPSKNNFEMNEALSTI
jgi:hypothetical protein